MGHKDHWLRRIRTAMSRQPILYIILAPALALGGSLTDYPRMIAAVTGTGKAPATIDPWYTRSRTRMSRVDQVERSWTFPVPDSTARKAIQMLEHVSIIALDLGQAGDLIPGQVFDLELMAQEEAREAEVQGWKSERMARASDDPIRRTMLANEAIAWRRRAEKARNLAGRLRPYLVRGLALSEGTGGFLVSFRGKVLLVEHLSLGRGPTPPMMRRPVVVFLDEAPEEVQVSVSAAE